MPRNDCPLCEGTKVMQIASTNIKAPCNFCDRRGEIPRPENFDITKEPTGLIERITNFFRNGEGT